MISILTKGLSDRAKDALVDRYLPLCGVDNVQWLSPGQPVSRDTALVVAVGRNVWRHVGATWDWRGFILPATYQGKPVFPTLSPGDTHIVPWGQHAARQDWERIGRWVRGEWPCEVPEVLNVEPTTIPLVNAWVEKALVSPWCVVDCEWNPRTKQLLQVGMAIPGAATAHIWWNKSDIAESAWKSWFVRIAEVTPIIFHNALADIPVLRKVTDLNWGDYRRIEDTCLLHSCLYPGFPHDLEWVASVFGEYPKLKHLKRIDAVRYNQGDVLETGAIWDELSVQMMGDAGATQDYSARLKLLPSLERRMREGVRVGDRKRAKKEIPGWVKEYQGEAGGVNLNSPRQMKRHPELIPLRKKVLQLRKIRKEFHV